jgi:hypothetical protein
MVNPVVYGKLVQVAKARQTITFRELGQVADMLLDSSDDTKMLGLVLDHIADQEVREGRPLLPVLVVNESNNMPGAGLFKYAKRRKLQKGDDLTFFASELKRVHDYWGRTEPAPEHK